MARTNSSNHEALAWVQDEVQKSLAEALKALTSFIENSDNTVELELCITLLRQINGIMEMLALDGAQLLVNEMLTSAIAVRDQQSTNPTQTQDDLLKGLLLLPNYLKLLSPELEDHPLRLIETVNELRINRGAVATDINSLFQPILSVPLPEGITPDPQAKLPNIGLSIDKISYAFQISLLYWIKNNDPAVNLRKMGSIVHYLRLHCTQERSALLWWAAEGAIEALLENGLTRNSEAKIILGKLNQPIKLLTHEDEQHLMALFPTELVQQLLLLVAHSISTGKHVRLLKETFNLNFFDAQQHQKIYSFSDDALSDVNAALLEQLQEVNELVGQIDQQDDYSEDSLQQLIGQLLNVADTLQLLSEDSTSNMLQQQAEQLKELVSQQQPNDEQLMALANTLLQVEDQLQKGTSSDSGQTPSVENDQRQHIVISECLNELSNIEETLTLLAAQPDNSTETLTDVSTQLTRITGSLTMLDLHDATKLLENTIVQMDQINTSDRTLTTNELGLFAEIIADADLYMQGIHQHGQQQPQLLENAQNILNNFEQLATKPDAIIESNPTELATDDLDSSERLDEIIEDDQTELIPDDLDGLELSIDSDIIETGVASPIEQQAPPVENNVETPIEQPSQFAEGVDPEIAGYFIEEANEILAEFQTLIPEWKAQRDPETLATIRRHFHTLKGSGRMAGASILGELAWSIEQLLNFLIKQSSSGSPAVDNLLTASVQNISGLLTRFAQGDMTSTEAAEMIAKRANDLLDAETNTNLSEHDELQQIFNDEADQHIGTFNKAFERGNLPFKLNKELLRAAHSLKGCANIAQVMPVAIVATQLDQVLRMIYEQDIALNEQQLPLLTSTIDGLKQLVEHHKSPDSAEPDIQPLTANLDQLTPEAEAQKKLIDPETLTVYLEETDELLEQYTQQLEQLQQQPDNADYRHAVQQTLATLTANAQQANLATIIELYQLFDQLLRPSDSDNAYALILLEHGYEELNNQIESLMQNKAGADIDDFKQQVNHYLNPMATEEPKPESQSQPEPTPESEPVPEPESTPEPESDNIQADTAVDSDLLEVFVEEYAESLESSNDALKSWQDDHNNRDAVMQLQRDLHTIKGGARLMAVTPVGDLTHQVESLVLLAVNHSDDLNEGFFDLLQRCQDQLADMQDQLANGKNIPFAHDLLTEIGQFSFSDQSEAADLIPVSTEITTPKAPAETVPEEAEAKPAQVEQVRVRADLLDFLTNFAGEVNISRDHVSQQNVAVRQQLNEMTSTVSRVQNQLRNLEAETETQILFRYEGDDTQRSEFDPLELDRFSMMQQLSRGLNESLSDLNVITQSIDELLRESDTILLQQSRLSTDLQQGLMNTRLLPFSGLATRLERIARQVNSELKKKSELTIRGVDLELDRTILDRIIAPLEHLIRNAIAHGIESPDDRKQAGKQETGQLLLSIIREGSEIVITLADNGQGIDVEKIRKKALEQNLISASDTLSDEELIQFIFTSGFSTADHVSQLAGRGVGMDVVSNEIKALKGRFSIQSLAGQGTTFIIRLPLTLSIMQVFVVSSQERQYAIPITSVYAASEHITVADAQALLAQDEEAVYEYNDENYRLFPLEQLIDQPLLLPDSPDTLLSLLLFHSGDRRIALLVDSITTSREIVLKSVGDQLANIEAIIGATIMGDGQVVFVLDIPTLVDSTRRAVTEDIADLVPEVPVSRTPIAMIVDDSITMRKASGNMLKRHGFDIITAVDGVDAIAQLAEQIPDIILLDIEMPRMDGFEFATFVRGDDQYKDLPIIMITSRTGDKHRNRAMNIGVNDYVGKPFQEAELIESLQNILGDRYPHLEH